jgi:Protein of unknown function (DUF3224)
MTEHATGPFEVTLTPLQTDAPLGRMAIDKRFHGPLEGTGRGEMLSVMNRDLASGGYVALEQVEGELAGRRGSFVLQHSGTMTRGVGGLTVDVVPDSGTGGLEGLTGTMVIHIGADGSHSYDFRYALPGPS